jgi:hypothetical protein
VRQNCAALRRDDTGELLKTVEEYAVNGVDLIEFTPRTDDPAW